MIRGLCLLVLLSGCAATAPLEGPPTLDTVNESLDGARVRIVFADGFVIDRATRVRVGETTTSFHTDRDPRDSLRTVPTATVQSIAQMGAVGGNDGKNGVLIGIVPGALMVAGGFALSSDAGASYYEGIVIVLAKVGLVLGGMTAMAVGASVGGASARAPVERRSTILYQAPVGRYLTASPSPTPSPPDR